jgi:hypothetical protein
MFQGADLVLLIETWHFLGQHLPHVERFDSLVITRTMQLGRTKEIKHSEGVAVYFRSCFSPNLSQWKERSHDPYLWLRVSRGVAPDLFVYMVYATPIGSKHENESLFQNLAINIVEIQTLGGIILLGGDFNARTTTLPDTIDTSNLCELLQALKFAKTEEPSVVAKRHNCDASVGGGALSSWTYVVTMGCSFSMAEHPMTNQGSSLAW